MSSSTAEGGKAMASTTETEAVINEFLEAMKKNDGDSEEGLKKAFHVLSKGKDKVHVSADVLCRAVEQRGLNLAVDNVEKTILLVKPKEEDEGQNEIYCEEFIEIMELLLEPTVKDQLTKIYETLGGEETKTVVLCGESGVGKTWMARKVAALALRRKENALGKPKFEVAVWVYLNRIYEGLSLQESVAYQLSVLAAFPESEAKKEESEKEKARRDEADQDTTKEKKKSKQEKIEGMIHGALSGKKLLLILDDEGSLLKLERSNVDEKGNGTTRLLLKHGSQVIDLGRLLALDQLEPNNYQVVITTSSRDPPSVPGGIGITVRPLTWHESKALVFREMEGVDKSKIKDLVNFFVGKTKRLPAEILLIARVMSCFGRSESGLQKLTSYREILEKEGDLKVGSVLVRGYERLPRSVLIDCYSSERLEGHFLHRGGMVNFNELICYWIMEGHLGHFDRVEDAYEEGHRVLMELMDCGLLQKQEGDYVNPSGAEFKLDIHDRDEFFRRIHPGLAVTFDMKLGRVALADGMIRTIGSSGQKLSTLLLDGDRIGEELPSSTLILESRTELEVLVISNPTHQHFQLPLFRMPKLRLLALRGCEFLHSIEDNFQLRNEGEHPRVPQRSQSFPPSQTSNPGPSSSPVTPIEQDKLTVLEISGPSSLKKIPENLFKNMPNLKTLNMSYLEIELLPSPFYSLTKIQFLILRGCSRLRELGSLRNLKDLQVLDISGATSFEKFQDKSLHINENLQILNLSQTAIKTLPLINNNPLLKFVCLSGCAVLTRLRKVERLRKLQVLDISGAKEVEEFCDPSLEDLDRLEILDVSGTAIRRLPSNTGNPRCLYAKGCSHLKKLPPTEGLSEVEILDLSGSSCLEEVRTEFFNALKGLRELNLSETGVKHLPPLSSLNKLRRLLLSQCHHLERLEELSSLVELEFLDLSGCKALKEMEDRSFDEMNRLLYLNLSEIHLDRLPSLSKLKKLKELYVRDCPNLSQLPCLAELEGLEILDHSGTILKPAPSFSNPNGRRCIIGPRAESIGPIQLLKLLGASTAGTTSEGDGREMWDLEYEDLKQCKWSISNWQGDAISNEETRGRPVYGSHFLRLLRKYPSLLTENLSRFHFLVYPTEAETTKLPDKSSFITELGLRDIYFDQVCKQKPERCLEIREFHDFPPCLGHLLKQAQFVVLIDNPFFRSLLDLGADNIVATKACWIESCNELEHVIAAPEKVEGTEKPIEPAESKGDSGKNLAEIVKNLEVLWVSDVTKLKSVSNGDIQTISFKSLKSLYLEYCPELSMICSTSLQLESLEILYVKYCQKLGTLFTDDSAGLKKLTELHLWGLEELKRIAFNAPSLRTLRVGECPLLEHVINASTQGHEHHEVEGPATLEILHVKFCHKLKTICESSLEDAPYFPNLQVLELSELPELQKIACDAPSLHSLKVGECPSLQHISIIDQDLKTLEIKYCDKLKTIFEDGGLELGKVEKMELLSLPELENINGANLRPSVNTDNCIIWGCPKLQHSLSLGPEHVGVSRNPGSNDARIP